MRKRKKFRDIGIDRWSYLVELLLEWESYLCEREMDLKLVKRMEKKHRCVMQTIKEVAQRKTGMGLKLMKFHAIVHLVSDILLYGVPKEFDTGSNESHHKTTKQAAKLTQRNESTFNYQTAIRLSEFLLLDLAMEEVENDTCVWEYFDGAKDIHWEEDSDEGDDDTDSGNEDADSDADGSDLGSSDEEVSCCIVIGNQTMCVKLPH